MTRREAEGANGSGQAGNRSRKADSTGIAGASSGEAVTSQETDEEFVGSRPEVQRLLSAVDQGRSIASTARYTEAATLFSDLLDCDAVDAVLDLPPGTARGWAQEDGFIDLAASAMKRHQQFGKVEK